MENDSLQPMCTSMLRTFIRKNYSPSALWKIAITMEPIENPEEREKAAEYITSLILKSETEEEFLNMLTEAENGVLKSMITRKRQNENGQNK